MDLEQILTTLGNHWLAAVITALIVGALIETTGKAVGRAIHGKQREN